jgi:hypothetical protein
MIVIDSPSTYTPSYDKGFEIGENKQYSTVEKLDIKSDKDSESPQTYVGSADIRLEGKPKSVQELNWDTQSINISLVSGFINHTIKTLNNVEGESLSPTQSAAIVKNSTNYLNSLFGNEIACRLVTTTMLIVRNNYDSLNRERREALVAYLKDYNKFMNDPSSLQTESKKLYKLGLTPL